MDEDNLNIEDLFQESFKDYIVDPSLNVWGKINQKLQFNQFLKFNLTQINIYYIAFALALLVGVAFYSSNDLNDNKAQKLILTDNKVQTTKKIYPDKSESQKYRKVNTSNKTNNNIVLVKAKITEKNNERITDIAPVNILNSLKALSIIYGDSLEKLNLITFTQPNANFTINSKSGCVPFEIEIKNNTLNAFEYEWDFGDGEKSKSKNPNYTYRYAGTYRICLTVKGLGGVACIIDSIVVHDKPISKIYWPYTSPLFTNQKIIIPNESENAVNFEWNFGDRTISKEKSGIHSFKNEGSYNIMLKAWTENNCYDSTIIKNISVISPNKQIIFPTAFTPSSDGSSSGHYTNNNYHNDIFHPITKVELIDYNLKIFSKAGILVFESNDIKIGWDGYYQNRMLSEGVYLYVANGKFENREMFVKKGNVTLIHN